MSKREQALSVAQRLAAARQASPSARPAAGRLQRAVARPDLARAAEVTTLQQRYGNRAVQRWLAHSGVQAQLTVGAADDPYERQANRVADQVAGQASAVQRLDDDARVGGVQRQPLAASITPLVLRKPAEEDELQRKAVEEEELQRTALDDDELKRAPASGLGRAGGQVGAATGGAIERARGGGQALPAGVRRQMETAFGADFHGVKVHTDSRADHLNRSLSARAFTTGRDVFFRKGEFDPTSRPGQKLLAHELTHVVQQGGAHAVRRAPTDEPPTTAQQPTEKAEPDLRDALTGRKLTRLQPGDVLLPRAGKELAADLTQYARLLQQLWRGHARGANSGFPAAGLALGGSQMARGSGSGVVKEQVEGSYYVFRCSNRALAALAAEAATEWSLFENSANGVDGRFSQPKHFDALAHSSRFNRSRAVNLAAFFLRGASVNNLLTGDFAIMCYQAAALREDVETLKGASLPPPPVTSPEGERPKTGLAALPPGALRLDPRRLREFQFAAELHRLARGDNPSWSLAGVF